MTRASRGRTVLPPPLRTFRDCVAAAKRAGWEDFIGAADYGAEFARLDALGNANERANGCTVARIAKLREYKAVTAASLGSFKLRRLALAAMQGLVWSRRDREHAFDSCRFLAAQHAASANLKRTAGDVEEPELAAQLGILCAGQDPQLLDEPDPDDPDDVVDPWLIELYPAVVAGAVSLGARGRPPGKPVRAMLRRLREPMLRTSYNKPQMRKAVAAMRPLLE